eukprot:CAMPEP_0177640644 /NCGR_PEP_ID=MMETSP0447-20121125/6651_1 /TAXON_ID=0 /ORGANISM="Stygamoeba regulata, Strain BSH-02190019" /LENGTH=858 /DNA_ID=CAMNT_0019142725 /DNA_START=339 /DNA_END=2915 /DNA_ORIENTATION=-
MEEAGHQHHAPTVDLSELEHILTDAKQKTVQEYIFLKTLGEGRYGKVKLATNPQTGDRRAIKILNKENIKFRDDLLRIERETAVMTRLRHPNIVQLHELRETPRHIFIIMEFAAGGDLYSFLLAQEIGRLDADTALCFFWQMVSAMVYCHAHFVVHRDLKPENIFLDETQKQIKIGDFGFSRPFDPRQALETACGSLFYAAPEIIKGVRYQGPEADVWSLGIILYVMVSGFMPFDAKDDYKLAQLITQGDYRQSKFVDQNREVKFLVQNMLLLDPSRRPQLADLMEATGRTKSTPPMQSNSSSSIARFIKSFGIGRKKADAGDVRRKDSHNDQVGRTPTDEAMQDRQALALSASPQPEPAAVPEAPAVHTENHQSSSTSKVDKHEEPTKPSVPMSYSDTDTPQVLHQPAAVKGPKSASARDHARRRNTMDFISPDEAPLFLMEMKAEKKTKEKESKEERRRRKREERQRRLAEKRQKEERRREQKRRNEEENRRLELAAAGTATAPAPVGGSPSSPNGSRGRGGMQLDMMASLQVTPKTKKGSRIRKRGEAALTAREARGEADAMASDSATDRTPKSAREPRDLDSREASARSETSSKERRLRNSGGSSDTPTPKESKESTRDRARQALQAVQDPKPKRLDQRSKSLKSLSYDASENTNTVVTFKTNRASMNLDTKKDKDTKKSRRMSAGAPLEAVDTDDSGRVGFLDRSPSTPASTTTSRMVALAQMQQPPAGTSALAQSMPVPHCGGDTAKDKRTKRGSRIQQFMTFTSGLFDSASARARDPDMVTQTATTSSDRGKSGGDVSDDKEDDTPPTRSKSPTSPREKKKGRASKLFGKRSKDGEDVDKRRDRDRRNTTV